MPPIIPAALAAPIITGGSQVANGILQGIQNNKQRRWNEKMYDKQRRDALADWQMQNEYNSPRAQMQRFQEAGLNKNLIYGQTQEAQAVRSTDVKSWNPQAPQFDGGSILQSYFDVQQRSAQVDLLQTQNTLALQNAALTAARTGETLAKTAKSKFDLEMAQALKNTSLQAADANLKKTLAQTQFTLDENERRVALTQSSLAQAAERILLMRAQTANTQEQREEIRARIRSIRLDGDLKQLEKELAEKGIYKNSPWWLKILENYLGDGGSGSPGKPFGGDLEFIPKSPANKGGVPNNVSPKNWYKW